MWKLPYVGLQRARTRRHQQRVDLGELAGEQPIKRIVEVHLPRAPTSVVLTHVAGEGRPETPSVPV